MISAYQNELRMTGEVRQPRMADAEIVAKLPTFRAALRCAVNWSGMDQEHVAASVDVDPSSFSRMLRDPRHENARAREFPHERLRAFMAATGSFAPLQWHAAQAGQVLVPAWMARSMAEGVAQAAAQVRVA